jgi:chemotaxis protein MotB
MTRIARLSLPALLCIVTGACATRGDYMTAQTRLRQQAAVIEAQKGEIDRLQGDLARSRSVADGQRAELERLQATDAAYREARARLEARIAELEKLMSEGGTLGVSVEELPGGGYQLVVAGEVLFGSGEDKLTEEGKKVLGRIASALSEGDGPVEVVGHTDNVPVAKPETLKRFPRGNLELSVARALSVADFLIKSGGLAASRISCVGYGEHRPVADNRSEEGRRKNRRVEIRVPRRE